MDRSEVRHDVHPEVRHVVLAYQEVRHVIPEVRHDVRPEAYCYRSYCYNMHLDPGQQAPSCTSLPEEVRHVVLAYQEVRHVVPEVRHVIPEVRHVIPEVRHVIPEAFQVLPLHEQLLHPNKRLLRLDCLHLNNPVEHS